MEEGDESEGHFEFADDPEEEGEEGELDLRLMTR